MSYYKLSEEDTKRIEITPTIVEKGWDNKTQIRQEFSFTKGRIMVRGKEVKRGEPKRADYVLFYKPNLPLAIVEAKSGYKTISAGIQQGIDYAQTLNIPFVYSSNGKGFYEHDLLTGAEREIGLDEFPSPTELWRRYKKAQNITDEQENKIFAPYYDDGSGRSPRYYQRIAINRTIEAIAKGQNRILLVMATGTGKTYTAFQIIWRLWKSKQKKRILFLADRNILVDQTKNQDFAPFGKAMTKITNRTIDKSYEIYLSLYQAVTGTEEEKNIYKQFSKDFFDLIVVDECHRGSAAEDSAWHDILTYFDSATQIGMTATPKEEYNISTSTYFGEPLYTYSLKQGIEDGFLAPYKVLKIGLNRDLMGWRPELGKLDKYGNEIEDKQYTQADFDRTLVLEKRTKEVAKRVMQFQRENDPYAKTIVFCENIDHADRMRAALCQEAQELVKENPKYIMKITGDDALGKAELDNFIDLDSRYPVIAVTSRLMSTGVDAKTCKLIVLDRTVGSMTEFKQIIGRGTRVNEEYGKYYFTIMDFRNATKQFANPEFDGYPTEVKLELGANVDEQDADEGDIDDIEFEEGIEDTYDWDEAEPIEEHKVKKYYVDDVEVEVVDVNVQYLDENGKLIAENIKSFCRNFMLKRFPEEKDFIDIWQSASNKTKLLTGLSDTGLFLDELRREYGREYDVYDVILQNTYGTEPLTREQRAQKANKILEQLEGDCKNIFADVIAKYVEVGISALENRNTLRIEPFTSQYGTGVEIVRKIGGNEKYIEITAKLKNAIYGD